MFVVRRYADVTHRHFCVTLITTNSLISLVGAGRFELPTPSPPDWCANQAALRSAPCLRGTAICPRSRRPAAPSYTASRIKGEAWQGGLQRYWSTLPAGQRPFAAAAMAGARPSTRDEEQSSASPRRLAHPSPAPACVGLRAETGLVSLIRRLTSRLTTKHRRRIAPMPLPADTDVSSPKHLRDKYAIV